MLYYLKVLLKKMDITTILKLLQALLSILIIFFVLLQVRGTGISRSIVAVSFARRGLEKAIFKLTFILVFLFLASSLLILLI